MLKEERMKHFIYRLLGRSTSPVRESPVNSDLFEYSAPDNVVAFSRALVALPLDVATEVRREYEARLREEWSSSDHSVGHIDSSRPDSVPAHS
jgi:hypothetical protein